LSEGNAVGVPTLESLYENAACGLLLASPDGMIRHVNTTFCSWVGFSAEELVNARRVQDLLTIGGRVFHQTHWGPLMQMQGSVSEIKLDMVHRDGRSIPILANAIRRHHDADVFDEIAVMLATDRQQYERELLLSRRSAESANERLALAGRRKDEFLATLAHELRGPLAPMSNVLQAMQHKVRLARARVICLVILLPSLSGQTSHRRDRIVRVVQPAVPIRRHP
jgi:PAS domain S-box-containing protein